MNPPVMSAFFGTQTFARDYVNNRSHFTLWKGPPGGDKDSCRSSDSYRFSSNTGAAQAAAATDAEVLFFTEGVTPTTTPRSCAQLRLGGGSYIWINRPDLAPTIVHESGHMLYGLGDEYCCDSSYESISTPRNLFTSLAGCQAEATNIGVSTTLCVKLADNDGNTAERWHIFDGGLNIMRSIDTSADWRFTGERARQRLMTRCSLNDCF